jgi:arylsulfatase A-like enzyme
MLFRAPGSAVKRSKIRSFLLLVGPLGLLLQGGGLAGCAPDTARLDAPSILLVTLDTTRADRIGAYGYAGAHTPTLDRLASEGVLFEQAIAPTPLTLPSHASLLTGVDPQTHGVRSNSLFALGPEARTLAEVLAERGLRTGAFVGSDVLGARFGLDQGFDTYDAPRGSVAAGSAGLERSAREVVDSASRWLESVGPDERFFLWVHFFDPHREWVAPEPWSARLGDPYDAEIAFADAELSRLLGEIARREQGSDLVVAVTADHGESLGEHGEWTHGVFLYQSTQRVPLILTGSRVRAAGARVKAPVSILDLVPTLLGLADVPLEAMPELRTTSLLVPDGTPRAPNAERAIHLESFGPYYSYRWRALRALLWRGHKLVEGAGVELYDLEADPAESHDLAAADEARVVEMRGLLQAHADRQRPAGWTQRREPESEERARLEALGYIAGEHGDDPLDPALPDARERIGDLSLLSDAASKLDRYAALRRRPAATGEEARRARTQEERRLLLGARDVLARALARSPRSPYLVAQLGSVKTLLGDYEAAIPLLEEALRAQPVDASLHFDLAVALEGAGRGEEAVRHAERAVALAPDQAHYHQGLVEIQRRVGRSRSARASLERLATALGGRIAETPELRSWIERLRTELSEDRES